MLLSEIVAVPLSAWIMSSSIWIPWMLGLVCEIVGALIVLLLPETKPKSAGNPGGEVESEIANRPEGSPAFTWSSIVRFARSQITELKDFVCEYPSSLVVSLAFFMSSYGIVAVSFMLQYVSRRFSWSLAEVQLLHVCSIWVYMLTCFQGKPTYCRQRCTELPGFGAHPPYGFKASREVFRPRKARPQDYTRQRMYLGFRIWLHVSCVPPGAICSGSCPGCSWMGILRCSAQRQQCTGWSIAHWTPKYNHGTRPERWAYGVWASTCWAVPSGIGLGWDLDGVAMDVRGYAVRGSWPGSLLSPYSKLVGEVEACLLFTVVSNPSS